MSGPWSFFDMFHLVEAEKYAPPGGRRRKRSPEEIAAQKQKEAEDAFDSRKGRKKGGKESIGKGVAKGERGDRGARVAQGDRKRGTDPMGMALDAMIRQYKLWKPEGPETPDEETNSNYKVPEGEPRIWGVQRDPVDILRDIAGLSAGRYSGTNPTKQSKGLKNAVLRVQGQKPQSDDAPEVEDPITGERVVVSWDTLADMLQATSPWAWLTVQMRDPAFRKKWAALDKDETEGPTVETDPFNVLDKWMDDTDYDQLKGPSDPYPNELMGIFDFFDQAASKFIGDRGVDKNELAYEMLKALANRYQSNAEAIPADIRHIAKWAVGGDKDEYKEARKTMLKALEVLARVPWDQEKRGYATTSHIEPHPEIPGNYIVYKGANPDIASITNPEERAAAMQRDVKERAATDPSTPHSQPELEPSRRGIKDVVAGQTGPEYDMPFEERPKSPEGHTFNDEEIAGMEKKWDDIFQMSVSPSGKSTKLPPGKVDKIQRRWQRDKHHAGDPLDPNKVWKPLIDNISAEMDEIIHYFFAAAEKSKELGMGQKAEGLMHRAKLADHHKKEWDAYWAKASQRAQVALQGDPSIGVQPTPQVPPQATAGAPPVAKPTPTPPAGQKKPIEMPDWPATESTNADLEALLQLRESYNSLMRKVAKTNKPRPRKKAPAWLKKTKEWLKEN